MVSVLSIDTEVLVMARLQARAVRLIGATSAVAGVAVSAAVVWHASYSAFSATTDNPTNNWAAGTVTLSDDDSSSAMFTASNIEPNSTGSHCIAVTSTGSLASAVKLYGTSPTTSNGLSSYINLTITQGTGSSFTDCSGFSPLATGATVYTGTLAGFGSSATNFGTGLGAWTPTGSSAETRVFQFTWTVDPSTPNTTQGGSASVGFTWEAQNS